MSVNENGSGNEGKKPPIITDEMKMELFKTTYNEELLKALKKMGKKFACLCCNNSYYEDAGRLKPDLVLFKDIEGLLNVE